MAISSAFTVKDGAGAANPISGAMEVTYGNTITVALVNTTGVHTCAWSIIGSSDSALTNPTFADATATSTTYPMVADPGGGKGASFGIKCVVTDSAGNTDATIATVGAKNEALVVPAFSSEETERDSTHGWTMIVNSALADNVSQAITVNTTDATTTTVISHALTQDTMTSCGCRVVTVETNGSNYYTFIREWTFTYERHTSKNSGNAQKRGADSDSGIPLFNEDGAWSAVTDLSGNTLRVRVTNDAAQNCRSRAQLWVTEIDIGA